MNNKSKYRIAIDKITKEQIITEDGHTMFLADIVKQLRALEHHRKAQSEEEVIKVRNDLTELEMKKSLINVAFTLMERNSMNANVEIPSRDGTPLLIKVALEMGDEDYL